MRVLFRADASNEIGGGHIMRCLALADALSQGGVQTGFATTAESQEAVPALQSSGHEVFIIDGLETADFAELAPPWTGGCDLLVVDHYALGAGFEAACRGWASSIMVIDDFTKRRHDCDILLDPLPGRTKDDFKDLVPAECRLLLGPNHALLRPQFPEARRAALQVRHDRPHGRTMFISFGGVDSRNLTEMALHRLAERELVGEVHVALGGGSPNVENVRKLAASLPFSLHVHVDCEDMASLMTMADVAIGAAGSMSWERCCLGLPSVAMVIAENQAPIAALLEKAGAAIIVRGGDGDIGEMLARQAEDLLMDEQRQTRMGEAAAAVCDGLGLGRVLDAVAPRITIQ